MAMIGGGGWSWGRGSSSQSSSPFGQGGLQLPSKPTYYYANGGRTQTGSIPIPGASASMQQSSSQSGMINPEAFKAVQEQVAAAAGSVAAGQSRNTASTNQRTGSLNQTYAEMIAEARQLGGSQRDRINRDAESSSNSVGQNLAGTGLYNTTIQGNMKQGVERNRQEALGTLEDALRQLIMGVRGEGAQAVDKARGEGQSAQADLSKLYSQILGQGIGQFGPTLSNSSSLSQSIST